MFPGRTSMIIASALTLAVGSGVVWYGFVQGQQGSEQESSRRAAAQGAPEPGDRPAGASSFEAQAPAELQHQELSEAEQAFAAKLRDDVPAEERREAMDALLAAIPAPAAPSPLVALLEQRSPRKPFEQLLGLLGTLDQAGARRAGFVRPLALALVRGDPAGESIARALSLFAGADRLSVALSLLSSESTEDLLAGVALARTRPDGAAGVLELAPRLVELMEFKEAGVNTRAFEALREGTLLELPNDPVTWRNWLEGYDRATKLSQMADAAVARLRTLQETNARLFKSYLREIEAKIERERATDPDALLATLDEEYPQIRALAARLLGNLLPTLQDAQALSVLRRMEARFDPKFAEQESVQIALAKSFSARPALAAASIRRLLEANGLAASVKLELIKGMTTVDSLESVADLLTLTPGEYADPVQLQLIEQLKLVADPQRPELMQRVFAKLKTRLHEVPAEAARSPYRRETAAMLDTLRFLVTIKSQPIESLVPDLLALAQRDASDRAPVFELLSHFASGNPEKAKALLGSGEHAQTLLTLAQAYPVKFDVSVAPSEAALARLYAALGDMPDELRASMLEAYNATWIGEGDWAQRDERALALARALLIDRERDQRAVLVCKLMLPDSIAAHLQRLPAKSEAPAEGEGAKSASGDQAADKSDTPGDAEDPSGDDPKRDQSSPDNADQKEGSAPHSSASDASALKEEAKQSDADSTPAEGAPLLAPKVVVSLREGVARIVVQALADLPKAELAELAAASMLEIQSHDPCSALSFGRRVVREVPPGEARNALEAKRAELETQYRARVASSLQTWLEASINPDAELDADPQAGGVARTLRTQLTLSCAPLITAELYQTLNSRKESERSRTLLCPLLSSALRKVDPGLVAEEGLPLEQESLAKSLEALKPKLVERAILPADPAPAE